MLAQVSSLRKENAALQEENAALREVVHEQREQIQALRDEVALLKKQKPKPKIGPSKLTERKKKRRRKHRRKLKEVREPDHTVKVAAKDVPEGSRFKGYDDFFVQELVIKAQTTRYRLARWKAGGR